MSEPLPLASGVGAAAVVERLAARQQQLAAEREHRQAQLQAEADTREDVSSFLASYRSDHTQLQDRCEGIKAKASTSQQDGAGKSSLLEQLEACLVDISDKERSIAAASYFLPPYELRSCTSQLQQLRSQLADMKQHLQPKRKFAFSKAVARTNITTTNAAAAAADISTVTPSTSALGPAAVAVNVTSAPYATAAAAQAGTSPPALSPQDQQLIAAGHGYAGLTKQLLLPSAQQLAAQGFVLHDLHDCDVFLLGQMSALRLQHLRNCRVYTGPVVGAAFVDSCSNCCFMLASYQVRIHSTHDCQFYLRVRSRPIIEHSSSLAFAPYAAEDLLSSAAAPGSHTGQQQELETQQQQGQDQQQALKQQPELIQQQAQQQDQQQRVVQQQQQQQQALPDWHPVELLSAAQLSEDSGLWQQVDDFGWVKASASPHWRVLQPLERMPPPQQLPARAGAAAP